MNHVLKKTTHALAIAGLIGAAGAPAMATQWDRLDGSAWSGQQSGSDQMAATDAQGGTAGNEITAAFTGMGMDEARARCFGETIAAQLSTDGQAEAAELVRAASNSTEVRQAVMNSGPSMVGAFSAANESCPESMGG